MKILFITRTRSKRGGHAVLVTLVRELRIQGFDTELVAFRPKGEADFPECGKLWEGISPHIITVAFSKNPEKQLFCYTNAAVKYLKNNSKKFDRIILDSWYMAHAAIKANIVSEKVFQLVQSDPEFIPEDRTKKWKAEFFSFIPRFPLKKIIVSRSLAKVFEKRYGVRSNVLTLPINKAYFKDNFRVKENNRINFVSSSGDFNIPEKGLDFLIDNLKSLSKYPFSLTLVSGKPIAKKIDKLPFPIKTTTTKTPQGMIKLLKNSDVYINTSKKESFCLCLAEALALGMPAIALDSVGNRDYMDGRNAIMVKNLKEFKAQLAKFQNVSFRRKLSIRAKKSMQKYILKNTIREFKKIISI